MTYNKQSFTEKYYKSNEGFNLLTTKGEPYDYIDSSVKIEEDRLPPIDAFYCKMNNENFFKQDYQHACKVWTTFDKNVMIIFSFVSENRHFVEKFLCEKRNAFTPLGIEPRTFRLPVECSIV